MKFWPLCVQYDPNWLSYFSIYTFILFYIERLFGHGTLTHSSNHIPLRLAKALWSFGHSECNMTLTDSHTPKYLRLFSYTLKNQMFGHGTLTHSSNHIPLRLAKALWSFGHSECNMTLTDSHTPKYLRLFSYTLKNQMFGHGTLTHSSNHIPLRLAKALWSFGHSECNMTLTDSHTPKYLRLFSYTLKN